MLGILGVSVGRSLRRQWEVGRKLKNAADTNNFDVVYEIYLAIQHSVQGQKILSDFAEYAIATANVAFVRYLLSLSVNFHQRSSEGIAPVHRLGEAPVEVMEAIVTSGCSLDVADKVGALPLHYACAHRHVAFLEAWVGKHVHPAHVGLCMVDCEGRSLFHYFAAARLLPQVEARRVWPAPCLATTIQTALDEKLLSAKAELKEEGGKAEQGDEGAAERMCKLISQMGVSGLQPDSHFRTPLFYAVCGGDAAAALVIINQAKEALSPPAFRAWLDQSDLGGERAITLAIKLRHAAVVDVVCNSGCSTNVMDESQQSPLQLALVAGREYVKIVMSKGAAEVDKDLLRRLVLKGTLTTSILNTMKEEGLIEVGGDIDWRLLHAAAVKCADKDDVFGHLLDVYSYAEKARPGQRNDVMEAEEKTLMEAAVRSATPTKVYTLLKRGARGNVMLPAGMSLLHLAAGLPAHPSTVGHLIRAGADLGCPHPDTLDTPMHMCAARGGSGLIVALSHCPDSVLLQKNKFDFYPASVAALFRGKKEGAEALQDTLDDFFHRAFPLPASRTSSSVARREEAKGSAGRSGEVGGERGEKTKEAEYFNSSVKGVVDITFTADIAAAARADSSFRLLFLRTLAAVMRYDRSTPLRIHLTGFGFLKKKERAMLMWALPKQLRWGVLAEYLQRIGKQEGGEGEGELSGERGRTEERSAKRRKVEKESSKKEEEKEKMDSALSRLDADLFEPIFALRDPAAFTEVITDTIDGWKERVVRAEKVVSTVRVEERQ